MAKNNQSEKQENNDIIKKILGKDLDVKVLSCEQALQVGSYLEKQGVRVGAIHTSCVDAYGYDWEKKGLPAKNPEQRLYLNCLARLTELGKIKYQLVTS